MNARVLDLPFNAGQNEGVDRILLQPSELRSLQNARLTRDGRLEVRPAYTAVSMLQTPSGPTLRARDVTSYRSQLVAAVTYGSAVPPVDLATYTATTDTGWAIANNWPLLSEVQRVWQSPSGSAARQFDLAYANSQLCAVQVDDGNTLTIARLNTAGVLLKRSQVTGISSARVVACGTTFVIVTRSTAGTMAARTLDTTGTTSTFSSATTLEATVATGTTHWDLASIPGTTDYLVTYPRPASTSVRLRRYTVAHSLSATIDVTPSTSVGDLAVAAQATGNICWLIQDGNDVKARILNASLTATVGPTTLATVASVRAPGVVFRSSSLIWVVYETTSTSYCEQFDTSLVTVSGTITSANVWGASKPIAFDDGSGAGRPLLVGRLSAGSAFSLPFYTTCLYQGSLPGRVEGSWDYGVGAYQDITTSTDTGGRASIATDGTYYYCLSGAVQGLDVGTTNPGVLRVIRFTNDARRQTAEMGGQLYVAGGAPAVWDGVVLSQAGFPDVPAVISVAQDASGSQTLLATYQYIALYEYVDATGAIVRSAPSAPFSVTLTGANNRAKPTVSTPRSNKLNSAGLTARVVLYRANPSDSVFFRVAESTAGTGVAVAANVTINDGIADATAETREILYTQSQKPVPNAAPQPCRFIAAGQDRLIIGGLPDPYQVALSQLIFPGEPLEFAHPSNFAFTARLPEPCTGVAAIGDSYIAFTTDAIYQIAGAGPQRNGTGEFFPPRALYSDGGCIDWRSIVSCSAGTFFQLESDKLYILRGNGAVEWLGQPVRDTLTTYPVITGSCLCSATQQVVFSCTNSAGDAGVLLIYDLRRGVWSVDTIGPVTSVAEYDGRLAYVLSGVVYLEDSAIAQGSGALPTLSARYGSIAPFGLGGQGDMCEVVLLGTYVGDSTVEAFASYDDGKTWTSLGTISATSANTELGNQVSGSALSSGDSVPLKWILQRQAGARFGLRFDVTNATNSGGLRLHAVTLRVNPTEGTTRLNAGSMR